MQAIFVLSHLRANLLLCALQCLLQTSSVERLKQVVQSVDFKRFQCVLIVCGHKNDHGHLINADCCHDAEAIDLRNLYIEEDKVRLKLSDCLDGSMPVSGGPDDLYVRVSTQE